MALSAGQLPFGRDNQLEAAFLDSFGHSPPAAAQAFSCQKWTLANSS